MDDERPPDNGICDDTPAADAAGDGVREGDPRARAVEAAIRLDLGAFRGWGWRKSRGFRPG